MHQNEIAGLVTALAPIVGDFVGKAIAPLREQNASLLARLEALEGKSVERGEKGDPGVDGAPGASGAVGEAGPEGKPGQDGRDGVDGKDGNPGRDGVDGKDAPPVTAEQVLEAVQAMPEAFEAAVQRWLEANPPAAGKDGEPGRAGADGKDGLDGKEGPAGRDGRDGLPGVQGEKGIDGRDGKDGRDGLSVEDFDVTSSDDGRTLEFSLKAGGRDPVTRIVRAGSFVDRGVWKEQVFDKGDGVTWGGSFFIAQRETTEKDKPGEPGDGWRLAVKRGRDGRDGKEGKPGPKGEKGDKGERGFAGMNAG